MTQETKDKAGFLGLSLPESLIEVIRHRAAKNRRSISAECRPALEDEFLSPDAIKPRLEDKQKTGKLRK